MFNMREPENESLTAAKYPKRRPPGGGTNDLQPAVPSGVDLHADDVKGTLADARVPVLGKTKIAQAGNWQESELPDGIGKAKISNQGSWTKAEISNQGRFGKDDVPDDISYQGHHHDGRYANNAKHNKKKNEAHYH